MAPRPGDADVASVLARPLLEQWSGRRLYARRPMSQAWTTLVWMSGGIPLTIIAAWLTLPALPLPARARHSIMRTLLWCLAGCVVLAAVVALPPLGRLGAHALWIVVLVPIVASRLCGIGAWAAHGGGIAGGYRTLEFWGGETTGRWVLLWLPLAVGVATDLAVFAPVIALVALATGQAP